MKTIVITGATSGIGNLVTKDFAAMGYKIFAGYRNIKLKKDLQAISENVIPFYIDMSKHWTITKAAESILEHLEETEKIDTLINVAGCAVAGAMECLPVDKMREQFEINTFSHVQLTQELFERLHGGKIINISSMGSFGLFPFIAPYCASKRSLDILFNLMEIECKGEIKVISVKPGVIKTPLWNKALESNKETLSGIEKYEKEFEFLVQNAKQNSEKGLDAQKVSDLIVKIDGLKKPKSSYTVGLDARFAEIVSRLPQDWINSIIKSRMFIV